jgi:hypothetical protein
MLTIDGEMTRARSNWLRQGMTVSSDHLAAPEDLNEADYDCCHEEDVGVAAEGVAADEQEEPHDEQGGEDSQRAACPARR